MIDTVERFCLKEQLFQRGDTLVIACSGGPDSLVLLDILGRLREKYALRLVVTYVHHGIRAAADEEVERVRVEAQLRHCRFCCHHVDVPALSQAQHLSEELTGRIERYRYLRADAAAYGAAAIAVAHHRDDQAETVLLHLLRGSGLSGLCGMTPKENGIIRPLLCVSRSDIEAYVQERGLTPCHDETNDSRLYSRNRIRLDVIPYLSAYNPSIVGDLNRLAAIAQGDEAFLAGEAQHRFEQLSRSFGTSVGLAKETLLAQPLSMQRRLLILLVAAVTESVQDIPFHYVETLRALAGKGAGKEFRTKGFLAFTTHQYICTAPPIPRGSRRCVDPHIP